MRNLAVLAGLVAIALLSWQAGAVISIVLTARIFLARMTAESEGSGNERKETGSSAL